jgi:RNA polymerase sigma factor (sigma-70 family)
VTSPSAVLATIFEVGGGVEPTSVSGSSALGARARDRQLAARLMAGDSQAFAHIYAECGRLVLGVSRRVLRDERMAEDVTQEVLAFLWEHPERYDPTRGSVRTWLGLLAHRRSVDRIRAEARRTRMEALTDPADSADDEADERLVREGICDGVRRALGVLPQEQREALVLAYFEGHSYRQVASDLAIPEGTAKSRIRLALSRMNAILRADLAEEGALTWS